MRMYKNVSVSAIIILIFLMNISLVQLSFTKVDLEFIKIMHQECCLLSPVCKPPTFQTLPPPVLSEDGSYIVPGLPIPFPDPAPPEWTDGSCCEDCSCDIDSGVSPRDPAVPICLKAFQVFKNQSRK